MAETSKPEKIILGSGYIHYMEFDGSMPDKDTICTDDNTLGYIQGGATLSYKPSYYTASDDDGTHQKTILTDEEATLKTGLVVFNGKTLDVLSDTARVEEDKKNKLRTVKIGGLKNMRRKKYVLCFHYVDKIDGDIWVMIVGNNQSGIELAFAKDKETVIDAEFKALPCDEDGTLITYIEEDKSLSEE